MENIVSLCSHCHNLLHYGRIEDKKVILQKFYKAEGEKRVNLKSQIGNLIKQKKSVETISKDKLLSVVKELSNIKEWDREKLSEIIYNIEIDKENNVYINYKYDVLGKV